MITFLSAKKKALAAGVSTRTAKPMSDSTALAVLVVGTVGLLLTVGALNGGTAPTASAFDGIRTYLSGMLSSTWVIVLALISLVAAVWQVAHGKGYGAVALVLGVLSVALVGPSVVTAAATATRSPVAFQQASPSVAPVALHTAAVRS